MAKIVEQTSADVKKPGEPARRPYALPLLVRYGSASKLTASSNGSGSDGGTMSGMHKVSS